MNIYTRNELTAIARAFYMRGFEDGRLPRDRMPEPEMPSLEDLGVYHAATGCVESPVPPTVDAQAGPAAGPVPSAGVAGRPA